MSLGRKITGSEQVNRRVAVCELSHDTSFEDVFHDSHRTHIARSTCGHSPMHLLNLSAQQ